LNRAICAWVEQSNEPRKATHCVTSWTAHISSLLKPAGGFQPRVKKCQNALFVNYAHSGKNYDHVFMASIA